MRQSPRSATCGGQKSDTFASMRTKSTSCRERCMCTAAKQVISWVFFAAPLQRYGPHTCNTSRFVKTLAHWPVRPRRCEWRKEWRRKVGRKFRPWHLDCSSTPSRRTTTGSVVRCALVPATALHGERVPDVRPQLSHPDHAQSGTRSWRTRRSSRAGGSTARSSRTGPRVPVPSGASR